MPGFTVQHSFVTVPEIWLWNEYMTHGEHTKATQFLRSVKDNRGETTGHFGVQTNLDTCLDLKHNNVHCVKQQLQKQDNT